MSIMNMDAEEIRYRTSHVRGLPPLHGAFPRLLGIIRDSMASLQQFESYIKYDQALAARVLRTANSAYYGHRDKVCTLSEAIELIGLEQVRSICSCAFLDGILSECPPVGSDEQEMLWKHGLVTARVAAGLVRKRPWIRQEEAYVLGLLHDLGRLVMAFHFKTQYQAIVHRSCNRRIPLWYIEMEYRFMHTDIGKWVAMRWGLPEVVRRVIEFHHSPQKALSCKPEVALITLANRLANSKEQPELLDEQITTFCCNQLYITVEEWNEHRQRLDEIWSEVNALWNILNVRGTR